MLGRMGRLGTRALGLALLCAVGCDRRGELVESQAHAQAGHATATTTTARAVSESAGHTAVAPPRQARAGCRDTIPIFENGSEAGSICEDEIASSDLTLIDLSNDWAPWVFNSHEGHEPARYRATYVRLADELADEEGEQITPDQQHLELYGIFPSFRVLRARAAAQTVHQCDGAIDDGSLARLAGRIHRSERDNLAASPNLARTASHLRRQLDREVERRGLASIDDLAGDPRMESMLSRFRELDGYMQIIRTVQGHLRCEGLLGNAQDGVFDQATSRALTQWQRKNMLVSRGYFDEHSRDFMTLSSEERTYQSILRALRERVVDATGLIEDGTAAATFGTVFGRDLNAPELEATASLGAMPNGAVDTISPATEAAARALGFTDPAVTIAALAARSDLRRWRVAVKLPPMPAYYSEHMDLRAEIDRGDVRRGHNLPTDRRPNTTLFVHHEGRDIPLVRWSTTIGGYQSEVLEDGTIGTRYKESPAGPRIWRDVIASPAWMPPSTTPDDDLVARGRPNRSIVGPGYRSAYGLLMVMHHEVLPPGRDGLPRFRDEGVRSHGSVSYHSMLSGFSHGCHRLFNHLALRLGAFLVRHRHHEVRGPLAAEYSRALVIDGVTRELRVESRGYLYELTPPVNVNVLEGTLHERSHSRH